MQESMGQPVVVENQGGAGGTIGAAAVAKSPPDGYTLLMHNVTFPMASVAAQLANRASYDIDKDFAGVSIAVYVPLVITAHPSVPANNLKELVELLKDIVLDLDGRPQHLSLVRAQFPSFREMSDGMGTIRIEAVAVCASGPGQHVLFYQNNHKNDISVYLVNALLPARNIEITGQHRDPLQRGIELRFTVMNAGFSPR